MPPGETASLWHEVFCKKNGVMTPEGRWVEAGKDMFQRLDDCPTPTQGGKVPVMLPPGQAQER